MKKYLYLNRMSILIIILLILPFEYYSSQDYRLSQWTRVFIFPFLLISFVYIDIYIENCLINANEMKKNRLFFFYPFILSTYWLLTTVWYTNFNFNWTDLQLKFMLIEFLFIILPTILITVCFRFVSEKSIKNILTNT